MGLRRSLCGGSGQGGSRRYKLESSRNTGKNYRPPRRRKKRHSGHAHPKTTTRAVIVH